LEQFHLLFVHHSRPYTILVVWAFAMVPLSLLQNVQSLQYASAIGIMAIATLIVAALVHYLQHHYYHHGHPEYEPQFNASMSSDTTAVSVLLKVLSRWRRSLRTTSSETNDDEDISIMDFLWPINGWVSILTSGPVVLFAFSCQANVCSIYDELMVDDNSNHHRSSDHEGISEMNHHPTITSSSKKVRLMQRVTIVAVCICATLYCSISVIALADFGNNVQPNMLSCYSDNDASGGSSSSNSSTLIQIATAAMALAIVMAFPLNIFPARVTLIGLWHNYRQQQQRQWTDESRILSNNIDRSISLHGIVPHGALTAALLDGEEIDEHRIPTDHADNGCNDSSLVSPLNDSPNELHGSYHQIENHENGHPATTHFVNSDPPFNRRVHIVSTLILTTSTLVLALILPNISVVFGLLGGTASSWLGFCVPGLLGIQLSKNECANGQPPRYSLLLTSWALLVGGIIVGVLTTGVTIYNTIVH
jgi:amino acid permease